MYIPRCKDPKREERGADGAANCTMASRKNTPITKVSDAYGADRDARSAYICSRIEDQIAYYEKQSARNKRLYHLLSALAIVANACVPVLSIYIKTADGNETIKTIITILSSCATVFTSFLILFNAKELWAKYRNSASFLTSLLHQYYTGTSAFEDVEGDAAFRLLARLSESHLNSESSKWNDLMSRESAAEKK